MTKNLPTDLSMQRAMMELQRAQLQEQQMQIEMYMHQQLTAQQQQYEQQMRQMMQQQQQLMQQQYLAANLTADDVRRAMQSVNPGENFKVEMSQCFEVRHEKRAHLNGAQITMLLVIVILFLAFLNS